MRIGLGVLGIFAILVLCGTMLAAGFVIGRQTLDGGNNDALAGDRPIDAQVATIPAGDDATAPDANEAAETAGQLASDAGDEPVAESANEDEAVNEANDVADEPAEPTAAATSTPDAAVLSRMTSDFDSADLDLLWEVWAFIEEEFDGELPNDEELQYAAIRGILAELNDNYTRFADPEAAELMREGLEGSFEGIGAFVRENDEGLTEIVRPIDGGPAEAAGVQSGDVVIAVNGEDATDKLLDEVIALIKGPQGTEVTITFVREDMVEPFDVTITRDRIEIPVVEAEMLADNIAYIHLTSFNRNATEQFMTELEPLLAQNPRGLILDLRDNPGGFLDQSISISDLFLDEGVVLYERSSTFNFEEVHRSDTGDALEDIPLVVLVNPGSASASEIVAGAIQDTGRAVIIGEVTFGKGSVQLSHTLSDGSELRVTIARWYTPNNQSIDGAGITPDIEVATPDDLGGEEDTQLQRAIDYLLNGE
jgi:carboxyl-terminal processing protease